MADRTTLHGFDASTYVRTVRMALAMKGEAYTLNPVNLMTGENMRPEHLARHPFGKIPVLEIDGLRLYETEAILRYLDAARPTPALQPESARNRARMDMASGVIGSYGYGAFIGGVAGYHLFPDLVGGKSEEARRKGLETGTTVLREVMRLKGADSFIAGAAPSFADLILLPIMHWIDMTEDRPKLFGIEGVEDWWTTASALDAFRATPPTL